MTVIVEEGGAERFCITADAITLGRDGDGDLCLLIKDRIFVSRRHCCIFKSADGYEVEDLFSKNGTYLNGIRLTPHAGTVLRSGSILTLGSSFPSAAGGAAFIVKPEKDALILTII